MVKIIYAFEWWSNSFILRPQINSNANIVWLEKMEELLFIRLSDLLPQVLSKETIKDRETVGTCTECTWIK